MADNYGLVATPGVFRDYYRNAMRTSKGTKVWSDYYNNIGMYEKASQSALDYDYNKAIGEAYAAAHNERNLVADSKLGSGFKDKLYADIDETLQDAYIKYRSNYAENYAKVAEQANAMREQVSGELANISENSALLEQSTYDYLSALYDYYNTLQYNEGQVNPFLNPNDTRWSQYVNFDESGNPLGLKSKQDIYGIGARNEAGELTGLYDENGNLTLKGVDYYDQLMNMSDITADYSYDQWLYEQKYVKNSPYADLFDWYKSSNPYASALENPTNAGLVRNALGMVSSDYTWNFAERMGGMTETQLNSFFDKFREKGNELQKAIDESGKDKGKDIVSTVSGYVDSLEEIAENFGIKGDLEASINGGFKGLKDKLSNYFNSSRTSAEMAGDWFKGFGQTSLTMAGAEAGIAVPAGLAASVAGAAFPPAAAITAAVVGLIVGTVGIGVTSKQTDEQRTANKQNAQNAKQLYDNLLAAMSNAALYKQRQSQIDEYNRRKNQFI